MLPSLLDVVFGVLMDVIRTSFSILADALFMVLKSVMFVLKALVKSGLITTVVTIGVVFVLIFFTIFDSCIFKGSTQLFSAFICYFNKSPRS